MSFLSELTYPTKEDLNGTYFYLFARVPDEMDWGTWRERHRMGIGGQRQVKHLHRCVRYCTFVCEKRKGSS